MFISLGIACIYIFVLFITIFFNKNVINNQTNKTFQINPKPRYLGFLGFMGFLGFYTYPTNGNISPFVFFIFFGFFGFYYGGKMSGTYMDERFQQNAMRAKLTSSKIVFISIFITLILFSQGKLFADLEYTLIAMVIVLSLILALGLFFNEYLLYRFDNDDSLEKDEE